MKCEFCGSHIAQQPPSGTCPNCGAALPAPPAPTANPTVTHVYHAPLQPGVTCCPRCHSPQIHFKKRGFRWGLALIMGLLVLPFFGFLFGFIGSKQLRYTCNACSHRWLR